MTDAAAVISVDEVSKTFGTRKALDGVSIRVAKGEMVAQAKTIAQHLGAIPEAMALMRTQADAREIRLVLNDQLGGTHLRADDMPLGAKGLPGLPWAGRVDLGRTRRQPADGRAIFRAVSRRDQGFQTAGAVQLKAGFGSAMHAGCALRHCQLPLLGSVSIIARRRTNTLPDSI